MRLNSNQPPPRSEPNHRRTPTFFASSMMVRAATLLALFFFSTAVSTQPPAPSSADLGGKSVKRSPQACSRGCVSTTSTSAGCSDSCKCCLLSPDSQCGTSGSTTASQSWSSTSVCPPCSTTSKHSKRRPPCDSYSDGESRF